MRNATSDLLVCFAVKEEALPFLRTEISKRATVLITGMGEKNAKRELIKALGTSHPKLVLSCGFAGGLNPELAPGEVVFSSENNSLTSNLISVGARAGTFHCAKRVVISIEEKAALRSQTKADAVEMESEVIHRICQERGIPCATIRVISDSASEELPLDFNRLMTANYELSFAKLILTLVLKPWKIPALLKLQRRTRIAAENLSRALESLAI